MMRWTVGGEPIGPGDRPLLMGIVNVTPDSFSDGGRLRSVADAVAGAQELVAAGADILDIGGESSRPGAEPVALEVELSRVLPLIDMLRPLVKVPLSVDTTKPDVARAAIAAGVDIVNDIMGLADPEMLRVAAASRAGVVIMHMRGTPPTMQLAPTYVDVVGEVHAYLADRVEAARSAGIGLDRIAVDPGIGFGKSFDHNRELLRNLGRFQDLGCPILVGTSRKGFLGTITGRPIAERQAASVGSALACAASGASVLRVHDVAATRDALLVWQAQRGWESPAGPGGPGT